MASAAFRPLQHTDELDRAPSKCSMAIVRFISEEARTVATPPSVESVAVVKDDERFVEVDGREVRISRPDKVYFPALERPSSTWSATTLPWPITC